MFRCRLTATRIIRGGTRQGDALFPRASPLQKSPTGAFFEFTPCGGISSGVFRRLRTATRTLSSTCKPLKRLDLNFPFCSLRLFSERGLQASLRVQSERSERLRELTPAARRRSERLRELTAQALRRRRPRQEDHTGEMKMGAYGGR